MKLFRVELARILSTKSTLLFAAAALLLSVFLAYIPVTYVHYTYEENGQKITLTGQAALRRLKELREPVAGELTADKLMTGLSVYQNALSRYGAVYGDDCPVNVRAYTLTPYSELMPRLREVTADADTGLSADYAEITAEDAGNFYALCHSHLHDLMLLEQKDNPDAVRIADDMYRRVQPPFYYYPGYTADMVEYSNLILFLIMLLCALITAPLFCCEYQTGADDILRSTRYGRRHLAVAKILCALCISLECIILSVKEAYMDAQEVMHMTDYSKITALYSRLSVGDEDRDGGESNSIQNQKIFLENYARGQHLTNIRHYIDDDESGRFFDRSAYSRMMDDVENGKIGVCIMKDLTRWGRDYLQVGNAMEIFRRNNVRFIAVNNGIDSEKPDTLEFAPFINIMSEWYAKDISKKVKTGIKTKGMSGKPIATEALYGYVKSPDNKDFWIIDEEAAGVVRLIFRLFLDGKNRNQIAVYLTQAQIPTPTFYMKERGRGTCKNRALNEDNRYKWNKATLTHILTRQEYCGDVVNFKTTKHFRDKRNHYVDRSQWQITENVHEPIIDRADFETAQRILENAPVRRPNGDGEIHPLSGLLFCKDCGAKMHIRIDYRNGGKRHVAFCSEYHKGKARNPKCNSPHIMDADLLMQTIAEVLKKIEDYSISNRAEFEALVKKNLAMQQTDQTKKQQKRIPQITTRLEQIDKVLNKLYEDNALGTIPQDRYEQMSQKYSEEYYALKAELATLQEQLSAYENAGGRAQKFLKLTERHAAFTDLTPAILNEFISRIEVHERDKKRAKQAIQHIGIYFNYIGKFENEVTQLTEPTEQEIRQMREKIEEAQKEKSRAYHRQYSREYRARNLEKRREYDRMKAREYRAKKKAQEAAAAPAQ